MTTIGAAPARADPTPAGEHGRLAGTMRFGRVEPFTLLDPTLTLPPLAVIAPNLTLVLDQPGDQASPGDASHRGAALEWELDYSHSELFDTLSTHSLRADPSTGFSRQLDRDVLELGMSWGMGRNRVGLGYQLQSARDGEAGLTRFLPGSEAATHAVTLGVSRQFGAGAPPPAPVPPFALSGVLADTTPSPSPAP